MVHPVPAYQILIRDETAIVISNGVAVSLALVLPRLNVLLKILLIWLFGCIAGAWQRLILYLPSCRKTQARRLDSCRIQEDNLYDLGSTIDRPNQDQHDNLGTARQHPVEAYESCIIVGASQTLQQAVGPADATLKLAKHHLAMPELALGEEQRIKPSWQILRNMKYDPRGFTVSLALMMIFLAILIGEQAITVSSSFIVGDSTGIPEAGSCGFFRPIAQVNRLSDSYYSIMRKRSWDALQLVEDFRNTTINSNPYSHRLSKNLPYEIDDTAACPFGGNTCYEGENTAIAMDTGFFDSSIIGINSEVSFQWRRRMACAPLTFNTSYMQVTVNQHEPYIKSRTYTWFNYTTTPIGKFLKPKTARDMELACVGVLSEQYSHRSGKLQRILLS